MPSFSENIFDVFESLRAKHRFVPARVGSSNRFASFVRSETQDVFVYLFVHDGRSEHANVDVDLWIAPPHGPGDGIDRLYVGYKLRIASEYEIDDAFFLNCEKRIVHFLPFIADLVPAVRSELECPAFRTLRWKVYMMQRVALVAFLRVANEGDNAAKEALELARHAARKKVKRSKLEEACIAAVGSLMKRGDLEDNYLEHFRHDVKMLGASLVDLLYVHALGELSVSLASSSKEL